MKIFFQKKIFFSEYYSKASEGLPHVGDRNNKGKSPIRTSRDPLGDLATPRAQPRRKWSIYIWLRCVCVYYNIAFDFNERRQTQNKDNTTDRKVTLYRQKINK